MLIGLDVGGTHTDAVLLRAATGELLARAKAPTRQEAVLPGMLEALADALRGRDPRAVRRVSVSTTLGLNALLTGKNEPVGMLVVPGPGLDARLFWGDDPLFQVLPGAQDHRGRIVQAPSAEDLEAAFRRLEAQEARAFGVVCKFSPKNPELELEIGALLQERFGPEAPVVLGSSVSGSLNFPRRMHTVWCNAGLAAVSRAFVPALENAARDLGLTCPLVVLKADAGVFSARESMEDPASSMGSGPAASLLGVWALAGQEEAPPDTLMIDMGGTSTDLALMAGGYPLLAPPGLTVRGRPTLIRSLWTLSLALGGDSSLRVADGAVSLGPDRSGPALSLNSDAGRRPPTLTDALNVLGLADLGDAALSRRALEKLAATPGSPAPDAATLARLCLDKALAMLAEGCAALLQEVNAQPVHTIRELLVSHAITPERAVFIGGPAPAMAALTQQALGLPVIAPPESGVANAIGAALALPTRAAELYADTQLGRMSIPDFGVEATIDKHYRLEQARRDLREAFAAGVETDPLLAAMGGPDQDAIQIVGEESFAMLDDRGGRGRVIRVRAQQPAGLLRFPDAEHSAI
jgi:N-methylhydantoinase A/oxoprolinase/acetone carboxylase beta subunit